MEENKEYTKAKIEIEGAYVEIKLSHNCDVTLEEMLNLLEYALKGVGFCFKGELDIVNDEK